MKKSKVGAVFYGIGMVLAYLGVQLVLTVAAIVPLVTESMAEAGGDVAKYQQIYMEKVEASGEMLARYQGIASAVSAIFVLILFYFLVYRKNKAEGKKSELKEKLLNKSGMAFVASGIVAVYSLAVLLQFIAQKLMPSMGEAISGVLNTVFGETGIVGLILAVIVAPIAEELLVRGVVMKRAKESFGIVGCIIITALLFSFLHLNPIQGLYVLPMGIFWGYLAYKYDSVIPGLICHLVNNMFAMLIPSKVLSIPVLAVAFFVALAVMIFAGLSVKKRSIEC